MRPLQAALERGAAELGLALGDSQTAQLLDYLDLLGKWGAVYNLTSVRDPNEMLTHHVLDSLAVIGPLRRHLASAGGRVRPRLLDVGAGAGLPGVVVAICCADVDVTCVDAVAKKAAFIRQVAASLGLPNLRGVHARVETLREQFDVVISRAFASLADFTRLSANAPAPDGVWVAMKGRHPGDELAALPQQMQVFHVEQLAVPGLEAQRCLVWMRRSASV